jgi:hypothetical protein
MSNGTQAPRGIGFAASIRVWIDDRLFDLAYLLPRRMVENAVVRCACEAAEDPQDTQMTVMEMLDRWHPKSTGLPASRFLSMAINNKFMQEADCLWGCDNPDLVGAEQTMLRVPGVRTAGASRPDGEVTPVPPSQRTVEGHMITSTTCPVLPSLRPYSGVPVPDQFCPGCGEMLDLCSTCEQLHCINPDCAVIVPGKAAS